MFRRALAFFAAALFSFGAFAAEPIFVGHDYTVVKPVRGAAAGNKIEVLEFFWYRCPHCFQLEPGLNRWIKTLSKDVQVRRVPTVLRPDWQPGAKLYYALEQMNLLGRLHHRVFDAYHIERLDLDNPAVLDQWLAKQGVDRAKFKVAYDFGSTPRIRTAQQLVSGYGISGVPAFVVDGKYATSVSLTGSEARLFEVLDQLVALARAEREAAKTKR